MHFQTGMILLWSGAIVDIPPGWLLCDGNNGTPDLRNRFIVGAGDTYNPDDTGGANSHTHTLTDDGHNHTASTAPLRIIGDTDNNFDIVSSTETENATTESGANVPPFHALAYIMKV